MYVDAVSILCMRPINTLNAKNAEIKLSKMKKQDKGITAQMSNRERAKKDKEAVKKVNLGDVKDKVCLKIGRRTLVYAKTSSKAVHISNQLQKEHIV